MAGSSTIDTSQRAWVAKNWLEEGSSHVTRMTTERVKQGQAEQHDLRRRAVAADGYRHPTAQLVNLSPSEGNSADAAATSPSSEALEREYRTQAALAARALSA